MVYACGKCRFEFKRMTPEVEQCPDCGKQYCIRPATPEEQSAYEQRKRGLCRD